MKADDRNFVFSWFNTLLLATIIGFLTVIAAKAENDLNFDALNGLFTPTQSEKFFQAGREDFEREIKFFNHPERYLREDLLKIDSELIEQMNQIQPDSEFDTHDAQYQLFPDTEG